MVKIQTVSDGDLKTIGEVDDFEKALSILKVHPDLILFDGSKHIISLNGQLTTLESLRSEMEQERRRKSIPLHRKVGTYESEENVRKEAEELREKSGGIQEKIRDFQRGLRQARYGVAEGLAGRGELSKITNRIFRGHERRRR